MVFLLGGGKCQCDQFTPHPNYTAPTALPISAERLNNLNKLLLVGNGAAHCNNWFDSFQTNNEHGILS